MKPFNYSLDLVKKKSEQNLFSVVSLFAGCGGSSTGYRLAGGKVLAINEFIKDAYECYAKNYPDTHIFTQDVRELKAEDIFEQLNIQKGELDILDGSPPCASFSMAGLREKAWGQEKKYSDTVQRTDDLFFEFARLVRDVQPRVFVAENVKGLTMGASQNLLGSAQTDLFDEHKKTIYYNLVSCGYSVEYRVLDSSDYYVPQARERIIFIGVRNDILKNITYPEKQKEKITVQEVIDNIKTEIDNSYKNLSKEQQRVYDLQLPGESMLACGDRIKEKISGAGRIRLDANKPCRTVTTSAELWHPHDKRTLTIDELKSVCSFPYDYYLGETFAKKWERLGRSVPPLMMYAIAKHIYNTILK